MPFSIAATPPAGLRGILPQIVAAKSPPVAGNIIASADSAAVAHFVGQLNLTALIDSGTEGRALAQAVMRFRSGASLGEEQVTIAALVSALPHGVLDMIQNALRATVAGVGGVVVVPNDTQNAVIRQIRESLGVLGVDETERQRFIGYVTSQYPRGLDKLAVELPGAVGPFREGRWEIIDVLSLLTEMARGYAEMDDQSVEVMKLADAVRTFNGLGVAQSQRVETIRSIVDFVGVENLAGAPDVISALRGAGFKDEEVADYLKKMSLNIDESDHRVGKLFEVVPPLVEVLREINCDPIRVMSVLTNMAGTFGAMDWSFTNLTVVGRALLKVEGLSPEKRAELLLGFSNLQRFSLDSGGDFVEALAADQSLTDEQRMRFLLELARSAEEGGFHVENNPEVDFFGIVRDWGAAGGGDAAQKFGELKKLDE